jgi:hypothetical protein
MTAYELFSQTEGWDEPGEGEPKGTFPALIAAMEAAGHPDPADWYSASNIPDKIYVSWTLCHDAGREYAGDEYLCLPKFIRAPGAAAELAAMVAS